MAGLKRSPLGRTLAREVEGIFELVEGETDLALPPDQYALVLVAAERAAPTVLRRAGLPPENDELCTTVARILVTVWGNALLTLDRERVEGVHRNRLAAREG